MAEWSKAMVRLVRMTGCVWKRRNVGGSNPSIPSDIYKPNKNTKKMRMFKNVWSIMLAILLVAVCIVIFLPVTLIFTEGENGEMTIWNWIGLAYAVLVVVVLKYLYKNGNGN